MDYVSVESLLPLSNPAPSHAYDPVSAAAYTEWQLLDEAMFYLAIPNAYVPRSDLFLEIDEASVSMSLNHAWEVAATLLRPSLPVGSLDTGRQTAQLEYASSDSSLQLSRRVIQATGGEKPGCIGGEPMQSGDLLCLVLRRVPAAPPEDPLPLRVFNIKAGIQLSETRVSDCPGRLGYIIDSVRDLFNEASQGFITDEFILRSVNRCVRELAQEGYWCRETVIAAEAGVCNIDIRSVMPDLQDIYQVCFQRPEQIMECVGSFREFTSLRCTIPGAGRPQFYTVQGNTLYVWPPPSEDAEAGFIVFHSYLPPEIHCTAQAVEPPVPPAYDPMLARYALKEAFLRDRSSPEADAKFQQYSAMYEEDKQRLLGEIAPPTVSLRPSR